MSTPSDRILDAIKGEIGAINEALESLRSQFGTVLAQDAAHVLRGWIRLQVNTGLTLVLARINGASAEACERAAGELQRATVDVMSNHLTLMMHHALVPDDKREEVLRFVVTYMNRAIIAAQNAVFVEFNRVWGKDEGN